MLQVFCQKPYICFMHTQNKIFRANKSLGQHFLNDENVCVQLVDAVAELGPFDAVIEVGPGPGVLTKYLYQQYKTLLHLVEYDARFTEMLKTNYPTIAHQIHQADFLRFKLDSIPGKKLIIGNFPYNISSQIIFKALDYKEEVACIAGMFQKEMAQRIAAKHNNKSYGIMSVLAQAFYEVTYLFDVSPNVFSPPPKVMSGIIKMTYAPHSFPISNYKLFTTMVKLAFNQRRKTMRNSLKSLIVQYQVNDDARFDKRPEQLSIEALAELSNYFYSFIPSKEK